MPKFIKHIRHYWSFVVCGVFVALLFYKVFIYRFVPFPGDLLVSSFYPYTQGGWEGYSSWITHKEFIFADVIRQLYPWRILAMDLVKQGTIPLWNVYSFSGNPLLANIQTAALYPLNILFFLTNNRLAWISYILLQPVLAILFMYIFIRSLGLSRLASSIAGIGFACMGYMMVWFEMGIVGHSALWLPLVLWGLHQYIKTKRNSFLAVTAVSIGCSILAGHIQTTVYVLIFSTAFFAYEGWGILTRKDIVKGFVAIAIGVSLAAVQIVPSIELMMHSPRDVASSVETFHKFIIPIQYIVMLFAPDFFGNPATGNYWGRDYGEFMSYTGIVLLFFAVIAFYTQRRYKVVRLALITVVLSLAIAFVPFISELLLRSGIPVLNTGIPSRALFLTGVGIVIAAAYGVEAVYRGRAHTLVYPVVMLLAVYCVLWVLVLNLHLDPLWLAVTKRNLILPTGIALTIGVLLLIKEKVKHLLWIGVFILMSIEYLYFINKYLPFSPAQYMFPQHILMENVSKRSLTDRVYGYGGAAMWSNLPVQWRLQSSEGYDPLYIKNYAELMQAVSTGKLESKLPRSDAVFPQTLPEDDSYSKKMLMNLLGVKNIFNKDSFMPPERFQQVYKKDSWMLFENKEALPRAAVFYNYRVIEEKDKSIKMLLSKEFRYKQTVILENFPKMSAKQMPITPANITSYTSSNVTITTKTKRPGILFLSDNYFPGWKATIDSKPTKIFRADYSFRAVEVPEGNHTVIFSYQPISLYIGVALSALSAIALVAFLLL
ncbi:MAG: YfhO family protein [Candidatus Roizmanbacteria bacterium]|nr:YfhO family protein [Candidatus Roizmanbacteria bacterium]